MQSEKINILDSLRAFAALSVCLFHFVCTITGYIKSELVYNFFAYGEYGVQMFFVISGFIIPWSMYKANYQYKNFLKFLYKRLLRLEPPYLISIVFALLVLLMRNYFVSSQDYKVLVSVKQIALHIGYLIPFFDGYNWLNRVYWTLAVEFQYYFFIALIFAPLLKAKVWSRMIFYLAVIGLSVLFRDKFLPYWLPVFALGIVLFLFQIEKIRRLEYLLVTSILAVVCGLHYPIVSLLFSMIPIVAILGFRDKKVPLLNPLGKFSYSIYLFHPIFGATIINLLSHTYTQPFQKILVILFGIITTLISSYLMYVLIERPSKRLSAKIKY